MAGDAGDARAREGPASIAVLGEMRELGVRARPAFHAELSGPSRRPRACNYAILVGEAMAPLAEALEGRVDFVHVPDVRAADAALREVLAARATRFSVKGSNARAALGRLVEAVVAGRAPA